MDIPLGKKTNGFHQILKMYGNLKVVFFCFSESFKNH